MSDRKYRQRGYQSEDGERGRSRRGPQRPRNSEAPRGRGLGKPTGNIFRCAACGEKQSLVLVHELTPQSTCASCEGDLYTCTHCRHFDTSSQFECRQEIETRISGKAKANECALFEPRMVAEQGTSRSSESGGSRGSDAKSAFDDLFNF